MRDLMLKNNDILFEYSSKTKDMASKDNTASPRQLNPNQSQQADIFDLQMQHQQLMQ